MMVAGNSHTCALSGGGVYCWGDNASGEIGDGTTTGPRLTPVQVLSGAQGGGTYLHHLASISASQGTNATCAVENTTFNVYCWGANVQGEMGDASVAGPQTTPVQVVGINNSGFLSASNSGSPLAAFGNGFCSILTGGNAACWGFGGNYQLGNGSSSGTDFPLALPDLP
jgi:serine/threonine-protein kinase